MKAKSLLIAVLAVAVAAVSCKKEPDPKPAELVFSVNVNALTFEAASSEAQTVELNSNADWVIENSSDWITINPAEGKGSADVQKISVSVSENTGSTDRNSTFTISCGTKAETVTVIQKGVVIDPAKTEWPVINISDFLAKPAAAEEYFICGEITKIEVIATGNKAGEGQCKVTIKDKTGEVTLEDVITGNCTSWTYRNSSFHATGMQVGESIIVRAPRTTNGAGTALFVDQYITELQTIADLIAAPVLPAPWLVDGSTVDNTSQPTPEYWYTIRARVKGLNKYNQMIIEDNTGEIVLYHCLGVRVFGSPDAMNNYYWGTTWTADNYSGCDADNPYDGFINAKIGDEITVRTIRRQYGDTPQGGGPAYVQRVHRQLETIAELKSATPVDTDVEPLDNKHFHYVQATIKSIDDIKAGAITISDSTGEYKIAHTNGYKMIYSEHGTFVDPDEPEYSAWLWPIFPGWTFKSLVEDCGLEVGDEVIIGVVVSKAGTDFPAVIERTIIK